MAEIARWKNKSWKVGTTSIIPLENLSFKYQQSADNNSSTEEKKVTNQRGKELIPLTFTTTLVAGIVDVRKEIEEWKDLVTQVDYFYLGGKNLGPALQLRKVEVSDIKIDNKGRMMFAKLNFEFMEYDQETTSVKSDVPPLQITASASIKPIKMISNVAMVKSDLLSAVVREMQMGDFVKLIGEYNVAGKKIPEEKLQRNYKIKFLAGDDVVLEDGSDTIWVLKKDVTMV